MGFYKTDQKLVKETPHKKFPRGAETPYMIDKITVFSCLDICRALGYNFAEIKVYLVGKLHINEITHMASIQDETYSCGRTQLSAADEYVRLS